MSIFNTVVKRGKFQVKLCYFIYETVIANMNTGKNIANIEGTNNMLDYAWNGYVANLTI